ncbi:MAG: glycosyltransferase family 2 protein [Chloroflexi bacterium]|nr:glycosyltransferase family 2 protein [Chloroflexota bacterium]
MASTQPWLSVVIPAYNEEKRLPGTLEQVLAYLEGQPYDSELLVVDDGSEDGTAQVVEAMAAQHPRLRLIRNPHRGKGYTVRTGMLAGRGRYILFSDADLATPIDEEQKLLAHLQSSYHVAIGSREGLGAKRLDEPWFRHFIGRAFNLLVRLVAVGGFHDTQCGFKAFRHEAAQAIFGALRLYGDDAPEVKGGAVTAFDVEVLFLALKKGYKVIEVPVVWRYGQESKVNPARDAIRMFRDVLGVRWNDWHGLYG